MTTSIFSVAPSNSSDVTFRAWGSAVSTSLAAVGLVKTADSGQINWSTVTTPVGSAAYQGYEVWRFADTLQGTYPLFLKVEFGSGTAALNPGLRLTVGKGSDGTGVLTGVLLAASAVSSGSTSTSASNWYLSSGDGSMLALAPAAGLYTGTSATTCWNLILERSRSAEGIATGTGIFVVYMNASTTPIVRGINYASGSTAQPVRVPAAIPAASGTASLGGGGKTPLFPMVASDGAGNFWQPRAALVGLNGDLGSYSPIAVSGFGTYLPIPNFANYDMAGGNTANGAILWQ